MLALVCRRSLLAALRLVSNHQQTEAVRKERPSAVPYKEIGWRISSSSAVLSGDVFLGLHMLVSFPSV
jgi:hypothetical protein